MLSVWHQCFFVFITDLQLAPENERGFLKIYEIESTNTP